jgi:replicative DNA helicase
VQAAIASERERAVGRMTTLSWSARVDAERLVLGAMMLYPPGFWRVLDSGLDASDFSFRCHRLVFEAGLRLWKSAEPVDVIMVTESLRERGELSAVGGIDGVNRFTGCVPPVSDVDSALRIIKHILPVRPS